MVADTKKKNWGIFEENSTKVTEEHEKFESKSSDKTRKVRLTGVNPEDTLDEFEEDTLKDRYLIFRIGDEEYGIEIRYIVEMVGIQPITDMPDTPDYVKGVINMRGKVIPTVDVRLRFGYEKREYTDRTCMIIINVENKDIALIVDIVTEIIEISEDQIDPPPQFRNTETRNRFVQGLGKYHDKVKILIDVNKLLFDRDGFA